MTIAYQPVESFEDLADGPVELGQKHDGQIPQYSYRDGRFVMVDMPKETRGRFGIAIGGASRLRDLSDVSGTPSAGTDGYGYLYDNATDTFVLSEISTNSTIAGATDFTDTTGAGTDGYSVVWDNGTSKFILSSISATPGGSTTQVQYNSSGAFAGDAGMTYDAANDALTVTGRVVTPVIRPSSDSTAAISMQNAAGSTNVLRIDTTNTRLVMSGGNYLHNTVSNRITTDCEDISMSPATECSIRSSGTQIFKWRRNQNWLGWGNHATTWQESYMGHDGSVNFKMGVGYDTGTLGARLHVKGASSFLTTPICILQGVASMTGSYLIARNSSNAVQFEINSAGRIHTNQSATNTNTPSGATAHQLPIYNASGTLLGYIPIYGSAW